MSVGEDRAIRFDEGRMTGHPQVRLHIRSRFAVGVQQAEAEGIGSIRGQC